MCGSKYLSVNNMLRKLVFLVLMLGFACNAIAQNLEALPVYRCKKLEAGPKESDWKRLKGVKLKTYNNKTKPRFSTTVKACWTEENLHLRFECEDKDIWGTYKNHDDPIYMEEAVEAFICADGDLTRYYELNVSPLGVVFDAWIVNKSGYGGGEGSDFGWNCAGLGTAVTVIGTIDNREDEDKEWTVLMSIPFSSLDKTGGKIPKKGEEWRVNFFRIDRTPTSEYYCLSPTLREPVAFHIPSKFGRLIFE